MGVPGITDAHVHLLPGGLGRKVRDVLARSVSGPLVYPFEPDEALAKLAAEGVDRVWCLPYAHKPDVAHWLNEATDELVRAHRGGGDIDIVLGATVHPGDADGVAVVRKAVEDLGARVLKLHCSVGAFDADDARLSDVWSYAASIALPVVVHAGHTGNGLTTARDLEPIEAVAQRYPRVPLIIAHCANPTFDAALDLLERQPNVYADLTPVMVRLAALPPDRVARLSSRLLFGSDAPNTMTTVTRAVAHVRELAPTADEQDAILHANAARLIANVRVTGD